MNIIYIGEAGSGKTELSLNTAISLAEQSEKKIVLIDMDQTKALFRLREKASLISGEQIKVKWGKQILDTPVTPAGIREAIRDPDKTCIIDVGGNAAGAIQIGQFAEDFLHTETVVYYCINPYRPFTEGKELQSRITRVKRAAGVEDIRFICNPNLGEATTKEDILQGIRKMEERLSAFGLKISKVAVSESFYEELQGQIDYETMLLKRYMDM